MGNQGGTTDIVLFVPFGTDGFFVFCPKIKFGTPQVERLTFARGIIPVSRKVINMKEQLMAIKSAAEKQLSDANSIASLEEIRIAVLGKKG